MRILVTGATGFVGRALCLRLERDHHEVVAWVRSLERARAVLASSVECLLTSAPVEELERELARCDAVVHLAGESVAGGRWTAARKRALVESRVGLTQKLVGAMSRAARVPSVLVSASAVGIYGDRGEEHLDENSAAGDDFLARLCVEWERAAEQATPLGTRVVCLRTGIVLGPEGGVLGKLQLPFRLGLGARLGSGRQFFPWIALDDLLEMFVRSLGDPRMRGAFNATAPEPASNAEFTRALAAALHRPAVLALPGFALRVGMGEAASAMMASQRALPVRWLGLGYGFVQPELGAALRAILCRGRGVQIQTAVDIPDHDYLRKHRPSHVLTQETLLDAPIEEVARFFSQAENLGTLTPPGMAFTILTPRPIAMKQGALIDYRIRLGVLPLRWRTCIEQWDPQAGFSDSQQRGPYGCWWHEHRFERAGERTRMRDRVFFSAPFGLLGRAAVPLLIAPKLRWIFGYRVSGIAWRFGVRAPSLQAPRAATALRMSPTPAP